MYLTSGLTYDYALKDALGNEVWTRDGVSAPLDSSDLATTTGGALIGFSQVGAGVTPRTMLDKARDRICVRDFGAVGDGNADDTTAI